VVEALCSDRIFERARPAAESDGPLVSVIVSLYNYAQEIEACLDSVKGQDHARLELIVVDDASTDTSVDAAKRWLEGNSERFERALLLRQHHNRGLSAARNLAFDVADSEYVFVLDADNHLCAPAIAHLLEVLEDSGAAVAFSQLIYFDHLTGIGVGNIWRSEGFKSDNYIDAMALVRKTAWKAVGGYSPMDYGWEDYDLWCKFVEAGFKGVYVPELLCKYRVHLTSMRHTDTTMERARLVHGMMTAHPWLDLRI
jgi:glycosyltransferase involved in cell wall biosynthesis